MDSMRLFALVVVGVLLVGGCDEGPPQNASAATDRAGKDVAGVEGEGGGDLPTLREADTIAEAGLERVEHELADVEGALTDAAAATRVLTSDVKSAQGFGELSSTDDTDMANVDLGGQDAAMSLDLTGSADEVVAKAEKLLKQVQQYIDGGKLQQAKQGLDKLRSVRDMLPQTLQDQIPVAEKLLDAAIEVAESLDRLP